MMSCFRHATFPLGCHLQRASRLVRRKFHSAYHIPMPLSDDSSRDDADKESEHSRRAARRLRTMYWAHLQTRNIANISIRRTYQPPPTSLYTKNNTYAPEGRTPNKAVGGCHRCQRKTKLSWSSDSPEQMAKQNRVETIGRRHRNNPAIFGEIPYILLVPSIVIPFIRKRRPSPCNQPDREQN